jgi:hypothetical protein
MLREACEATEAEEHSTSMGLHAGANAKGLRSRRETTLNDEGVS